MTWMTGSFWTEGEDWLVRQHYCTDLDGLVKMLPGRSRRAIIQHAHRLGLKQRTWTDAEDDRIVQCYPEYGARYCQQFMEDRSIKSIQNRANKLCVYRKGRKKPPNGDWLEAQKLAFNKPWR
jgi:hypothetical protein